MWQRQPKPPALKVCFGSFSYFHECSEWLFFQQITVCVQARGQHQPNRCNRTCTHLRIDDRKSSIRTIYPYPYKQSSERAANVALYSIYSGGTVKSRVCLNTEQIYCNRRRRLMVKMLSCGLWTLIRTKAGLLPVTSWDQSVWHQGKWGEAATLTLGYHLTFVFLIMAVLRALISITVYACSQGKKQLYEQNELVSISADSSSIMFEPDAIQVNSNNVSVKI